MVAVEATGLLVVGVETKTHTPARRAGQDMAKAEGEAMAPGGSSKE